MVWETVIGLEIHSQLNTKSKIFSGASTEFGAEPNTQACAVDLGLPGVLPVLNKEAVNMALRFGLAVNAKINQHSIFARKNYFYPDESCNAPSRISLICLRSKASRRKVWHRERSAGITSKEGFSVVLQSGEPSHSLYVGEQHPAGPC